MVTLTEAQQAIVEFNNLVYAQFADDERKSPVSFECSAYEKIKEFIQTSDNKTICKYIDASFICPLAGANLSFRLENDGLDPHKMNAFKGGLRQIPDLFKENFYEISFKNDKISLKILEQEEKSAALFEVLEEKIPAQINNVF